MSGKRKDESATQPAPHPVPGPDEIARLPYRRGVGIMLLNRQGQVFAGRRSDTRAQAWQMPQGGIDEGEAPKEAAFRGLEEEVGTRRAEILAESARWYSYDLPPSLVPRVWGGRYRGQTQKWFAMRFVGDDSEIDIATADAEFTAWRWVALPELPGLIVPFKRPLYRDLIAEFGHLAASAKQCSDA
ncbi:MAG: RNA pyrophosphohydrolase [Kiloniellales bacterium]